MDLTTRTPGRARWALGLAGLLAGLVPGLAGPALAQVLPVNPDMTCTVSQPDFNGWFASQPGLNQPVRAADSVNLDTSKNCNFYKWSAQMFLWAMSPATGGYHGGRVIDSQVFFQLDNQTLVNQVSVDSLTGRQGVGSVHHLFLRAAKSGPDGLPIVVDAKGHLREFVTEPEPAPTARDVAGGARPAQIASVKAGSDGKALFLDADGKRVEGFTPTVTPAMLPEALGRLIGLASPPRTAVALDATSVRQRVADALTSKHVLIKIRTKNGPAFVEAGTDIVQNISPGQAGGNGVLISQQNNPVFYETLVNDVYAWYLTGRKTQNGISPFYVAGVPSSFGLFPTTAGDLASVIAFSKTHGGPAAFPDPQALAIEVKLAWVDASTLPGGTQGYITTVAEVPVYDKSNSTDWKPAGAQITTLALVGAHIVGSAAGHPEMIWATFEHQANTPLAQYTYNSGGQTVTVPQNTAGAWLFAANNAEPPFDADPLATYDPSSNDITSTSSAAIGPNNIMRQKAWGVASDGQPNQEDATAAASNTEIISLDTDVRAKLNAAGAGTDPRFNYLLVGATWTFGGAEPTCPFPNQTCSQIDNNPVANEIGTSYLENSTMETFFQGVSPAIDGQTLNCMSCHQSSGQNPQVKANTNVSHVFSSINPLPTVQQ